MSTEERVRVRPGALIFAIIFFIVLLVISDIESLYTLKPGTFFGGFAISIFWIAVINELIGRVNPRLKLNPAELLVIFSCFTFIIGANYYVRGVVGASGIFMYLDHVYTGLCAAMNIEAFKDYYLKVVPSFMFPKTARVIEMIWKGKTIGEVIPWGEFITPIAFWSLYLISVILLGVFIGFVAAKPWTEVERLVFPMSVPASYLLQVSGEGKLFKYKNAQKIFWGMFIIGVIFSILPLLTEVLPPVALVAFTGWGQTPVDIYPLAAALPGAWARGVLMIDQVALMMLLRDDVYYTAIFAYIVFGVLYQAIAVRTGIIPYEPGMEFRFNWENVPAWWPPVPYAFIGSGAAFGVGVWMLYQMRDRFKAIFRSIVGKEVVVEDGLSLRALGLLGLGAAILWLIVWTAAGVPFLISLFVLIGWFIWYVHMARVAAEFWWHNVDFCSDFPGWTLYYPIGASLGYWPWSVPPEGNNYAWFATCWLMYGSGGMWVTRTHGQGSAGMVTIYKIAHDIKMSIKDLLVANVLIVIIGVPVAAIIHTRLHNCDPVILDKAEVPRIHHKPSDISACISLHALDMVKRPHSTDSEEDINRHSRL